ncbi:MAG TPA: hypothetical protein VGA70_13925 [Longimicrobiales bacterium]|jgi:hypothetical protein
MPTDTPRPRRARGNHEVDLATVLCAASLLGASVLGASMGAATPAAAQNPPAVGPAASLRVFLDCEPFICDFDHFRREVSFVNYVRNREDAQVHVLVTRQGTGAGGSEYAFNFIGLGDMAAQHDTLRFTSLANDTEDETRTALTQLFTLGLVPFLARTPTGRLLDIRLREVAGQRPPPAATVPEDDPWDLWFFRLGVSGEIEGESRQRETSLDGSVSASRTTEDLKISLRLEADYGEEVFELDDGDEVSITRSSGLDGLIVWSLGDHWSAGGSGSLTSGSRNNQDLTVRLSPALEYDIYPYAESTRRQITFLYKVGMVWYDYDEVTQFGRMGETRPEHSLDVSAGFQQPWGQINASLEGSTFLDDWTQHRIDFFANVELRLFRGVSLDVSGNVARVQNQIYLPVEDLSDEDILLGRRELGTEFEYSLDVGLSFNFGSVFNNVVNPRMNTGGGGRFR